MVKHDNKQRPSTVAVQFGGKQAMPYRILIVVAAAVSIGGCATAETARQARDEARAARAGAETAKQSAEEARRAANAAASAAYEALSVAQEVRQMQDRTLEMMMQSSAPEIDPPASADRVLVPNADYAPLEGPYYRVWYGTNREPDSPGKAEDGFSARDGGKLHYGRAIVYVPKSHKFGETGSWWGERLISLTDDRLKITSLEGLSSSNFVSRMSEQLANRAPGKRAALVYIHGYNTNFEEAILRAAQIGFDLKVEGITAVYSWPSAGSGFGYSADEATIEASEGYFEEFLRSILSNDEVETVNVLAHSMGNRALLRVAERLARDTSLEGKPINQIVLAAPDVDVRTFRQLASFYSQIANRTTMYVSAEDRALQLSGFLHKYQRAGIGPPVTVLPGIDTIAVDAVDVSVLGHGYFADAEALLYDIFDLIGGNDSPDTRQRLQPAVNRNGDRYWFFGE